MCVCHFACKPLIIAGRVCAARPSPGSWLGVGIACYRLNELTEAEEALAESNIYDSNESDVCLCSCSCVHSPTVLTTMQVWAYLSMICARLRRQHEAEQAVKYAVKLGLQDASLKREVKMQLIESGYAATFEDFAAVFA